MKLVFWILILVGVIIWLLYDKKQSVGADASASAATADGRKATDGEAMLQCAHCGIHLPASESIVTPTGAVFCSEEHRLQHARS